MIHEFQSLDELESSLIKDREDHSISPSRFPIRFIFLNSQDELKRLTSLLSKHNTKRKELSSLLYTENSWFTPDEIIEEIKNIDETTLVLPLSEYIRFLNDAEFLEILTLLSQIENNKIKIYVPLIGLWERFNNIFWNDFYRKDNWAPIWRLKSKPEKIKIYQINFDMDYEINPQSMELVPNTKAWFDLWKKDNIKNIVSLVKPVAVYFENSLPDNTFSRELLNNPKEYLSKILGIDINIDYKEDDKKYWDKILANIAKQNKKYKNFIDYFNDTFNINDARELNELEYIDLYLKKPNNSCEKWLIKNFFIDTQIYPNSYLERCFRSFDKLDNNSLTNTIFFEIFNNPEERIFLKERKELLKFLSDKKEKILDDEFENKYKNIENLNYNEQLKFLTTSTYAEKEKIIEIVQKNGIENTLPYIKEAYPELAYYLDWNINLESVDPWIIDYFKEYNKSKILHKESEKLTKILNEKNHPDNFYDWYYDLNSISKHQNEEEKTIWIDGLGAEWMPLLISLLNKHGVKYGKEVTYKTINRVNIPSATKFNKRDCDEKISDLDKFIHDNHYKYPNSLINEIEIIDKIAQDIVALDYPKISIVSDHGFSFLCNKDFGHHKKHDFEDAEHGGRYILSNQKGRDRDDYMYIETESEDYDKEIYRVASKHVSLYNTPSYEVHGGITPEEVLVPHIIVENNDNIIDYHVSTSKSKINKALESKIPIEISPMPKSIPTAIWNNKKLEVIKKDDAYFIKLLPEIKLGRQTIDVKINDKHTGKINIMIESGGIQNNEADWGI